MDKVKKEQEKNWMVAFSERAEELGVDLPVEDIAIVFHEPMPEEITEEEMYEGLAEVIQLFPKLK